MPERDELIRRQGRSIAVTRVGVVAVALFLVAILVATLWTVVTVRQTQKQNSPLVEQVARVANQIADCTTTGGECAQRGADQQQAAIKLLLQGTKAQTRAAALASATAAAICIKADPASTVPEIAACVKEQLRLVTN